MTSKKWADNIRTLLIAAAKKDESSSDGDVKLRVTINFRINTDIFEHTLT